MAATSLDRRTDNLPAEVTRFIGRSAEQAQVRDALGRYRLVTLRGPGGVGKTRLALRVAGEVRRSFEDGVWLAELSALRNAELLARTVAAALGVPDQSTSDPVDLLADYVADRHLLLILDTCEHLVDACALLSEVLMRAAPRLRILATSREPLDVNGEQSLLVQPLMVPGAGEPAAECDAVRLFVDRAEAMVPGFALGPDNEGPIIQLCQRLDGIPLALELAAVRLRTMSIDEIVTRIDDRFRFLGTARSSLDRHQTLRAAVDWSHDLCTDEEQWLWARLSVFPGDFDLDAAEHVCSIGELANGSLLDVLGRLVDKSVVLYEHGGGRYRLLDTIREYGANRVVPEEAAELGRRHRDHYLAMAEQAARNEFGPGQTAWLTRLQQETHNLRVALDYCFGMAGEEASGGRLTVLLRNYWLIRGLFAEGRRWHELALAVTSASSADHAWARYGAGVLAVQQGDFAHADPLLAEAAGHAADLGDDDLAAHVATAQGMSLFHSGDVPAGKARMEEALGQQAKVGYRDPFALSVFPRLATACLLDGDLDRAIALCERALELAGELGDQWNQGSALWVRGAARWISGQPDLAIEDALACLRIKEELGDLHSITQSIDLLAVSLATTGEFVRAAELCGAGDALWQLLGTPHQAGPHYAAARAAGAEMCRAALGDERFEALRRHGASLSVTEAIALARSDLAAAAASTETSPLTRRELEVAALVAAGLGNREIAERLVLSKRTIDTHIDHIFVKLGFSSRAQVAVWFSHRPDPAG